MPELKRHENRRTPGMLGEGRKTWMMLPDLLLVVLLTAVVAGMLFSFVKKFKPHGTCGYSDQIKCVYPFGI